MEWENEAPTLAALPRITPYRVPDGYFEDVAAQVKRVVFLKNLGEKEGYGFTVPTNYFEELNTQIISRIAVEQFKSVGFTTPTNYFEKLQASILDQTVNVARPKTKVVRLWHTDFMKYAAAACFILITASGLYLNEQNKVKQVQSTEIVGEAMLYDIDESVIIQHLSESQVATHTSASQAEMESYILEHYSANDLSNNL